jgi:hypothetical protein
MTTKRNTVKNPEIKKQMDKIHKLFRGMEKDKHLPTFGDHFATCMILGIAENVNLKKLYPKTYSKIRKYLAEHRACIEKARMINKN